uniref:Serine/threonine-protein kinase AFC2-like n=1 Tax=Rhizophora mucronata TaxID=61149 RepID=A0A2P2LIW7_RHIMU
MHDMQFIHTNLKPENILFVSPEYIKILDYKVHGSVLYQFMCHVDASNIYLLVLCIIFVTFIDTFAFYLSIQMALSFVVNLPLQHGYKRLWASKSQLHCLYPALSCT